MTRHRDESVAPDAARPQAAHENAAPPEADPTARIAELEVLLKEKSDEAKANLDRYLRAVADAENFKKRLQRDKAEAIRYANENVVRDLLPILDNLERAVEHAQLGGDGRSLVEGVEMTLRLFRDALDRHGVKPLHVEPGTPFDPSLHEASEIAAASRYPANVVIEQREPGYFLNDRLIRPARVVVTSSTPGERRSQRLKRHE